MGKLTASINVTLDGCCDHTRVVVDDGLQLYAATLIHGWNTTVVPRKGLMRIAPRAAH